MKNAAFAVLFSMLVVACSSGTAVTELPQNVTSRFSGTFQNTPGSQNGTLTIDIVESATGVITGNIIFTSSASNCLRNAPVNGTSNGFNVSLSAAQNRVEFVETTTVTRPGTEEMPTPVVTTTIRKLENGQAGTTTTTAGDGTTTVVVTVENALSATLNMQFAVSNNGNTLSGSYVTDGNTCSNQTGSGSMNLSR